MLLDVTSRLRAIAFVLSTYVSLMEEMCIMEESLRVGLKIKLPLVRHVILGRPRLDLPVFCVICPFSIFLEIES